MKKKILIGSIIAVVLLVLVSFSPSITADVSKPDIDMVEEDVTPTPIVLVLQLMTKLRNHKGIQNVESEDEILQIIESDEEINNIFEQLTSENEGCGCEDDTTPLEWEFPILCILLVPLLLLSLSIWMMGGVELPLVIVGAIGGRLNCFWYL